MTQEVSRADEAGIRAALADRNRVRRHWALFGTGMLALGVVIAWFAGFGLPAFVFLGVAAAYLLPAWLAPKLPAGVMRPLLWALSAPFFLFMLMTLRVKRCARYASWVTEMSISQRDAARWLREHPDSQAAREWRDERPSESFDVAARRFREAWERSSSGELAGFLPPNLRERAAELWDEPIAERGWSGSHPALEDPEIEQPDPWTAEARFPVEGRAAYLETHWLHREGEWRNTRRDWPSFVAEGKPAARRTKRTVRRRRRLDRKWVIAGAVVLVAAAFLVRHALVSAEDDRAWDERSMKRLASELSAPAKGPTPLTADGRIDVYRMLAARGLGEQDVVRLCLQRRTGTGPTEAHVRAGNYDSFPYQRFKGAIGGGGAGDVPLLWDREPRDGRRLVALSGGAAQFVAEEKMQAFFANNPGQE